ncbi:MAG: DUF86 domain-containing protein [Candidatus Kapaibacterium sp.]
MYTSVKSLLQHIFDEIDFLIKHSSLTEEDFMENETLKRAFVRSIEIIGEASKKIPDDFKQSHPDIEWRNMARMRDRLIHDYFGIDYAIVWDVVRNKIPALKEKIHSLIDHYEDN